ncbi:MAG: YihA family ribosome biogenesis GTP-binding protein [Candidatus Cloacimonetes bacterium]|nr:YihA family ribosome biogenesis GTP-binding protein [Candidatus Cloacimonadota bacterium]
MRIVQSEFIKSAVKPEQYPDSQFNDIAFVGKSNVGKSSMINILLQRKAIAKISTKPGKTRLINFFLVRYKTAEDIDGFVNFVDLPGYGFARVSQAEKASWRQMITSYLTSRKQLRGVVVLVDSRHPADEKDRLMLELLSYSNIPFLLVATKADKLPKNKIKQRLDQFKIEFNLPAQEVVAFSALTNRGREEIIDWLRLKVS